jgi:hypothetical protein
LHPSKKDVIKRLLRGVQFPPFFAGGEVAPCFIDPGMPSSGLGIPESIDSSCGSATLAPSLLQPTNPTANDANTKPANRRFIKNILRKNENEFSTPVEPGLKTQFADRNRNDLIQVQSAVQWRKDDSSHFDYLRSILICSFAMSS